jgi:hypothetical protein
MRTLLPTTLLLTIVLIVGCSQSGDFGAFLVPQVAKYGGHTRLTGVVPELHARWTVRQGANGFTAHITDVPFSAVDGFMREVYGAPNISIDAGLNNEKKRVWGAADIGVGIQLISHKNDMEIICVKGGP